MASGWTVDTLRKHFEKILKEKDKALAAALVAVKEENRKSEIAAEKRFDLLNELRSGVATKDEVRALEKIVEDLKTSRDTNSGQYSGISKFMGWIVAAFAIATAVAGFVINLKK